MGIKITRNNLILNILLSVVSLLVCGFFNFIFMLLGDLAVTLSGSVNGIGLIIAISSLLFLVMILNIVILIISAISFKAVKNNGEHFEKYNNNFKALFVLLIINAVLLLVLAGLSYTGLLTLLVFGVLAIVHLVFAISTLKGFKNVKLKQTNELEVEEEIKE